MQNILWIIILRSNVPSPLKSSNYCTSHTCTFVILGKNNLIRKIFFFLAGNKYTAVQSVTRVVSSTTHDVSKANTVDFCITDGSSSTTHDVSNVSSDVLNNQLFISLLIISIIICLIFVAYVSIRVIEKYLIQLN